MTRIKGSRGGPGDKERVGMTSGSGTPPEGMAPAPAPETGWAHFEHEADMGVRGWGPTREAAFEQAALAMTATIADPADVRAGTRVTVSCEAPDDELLLVDWLNALVYEMAVRRMLFRRFLVRVEEGGAAGLRLAGEAWGEPVDRNRHHPAVEVKGATYTALHVGREAGGRWIAQCVVDV